MKKPELLTVKVQEMMIKHLIPQQINKVILIQQKEIQEVQQMDRNLQDQQKQKEVLKVSQVQIVIVAEVAVMEVQEVEQMNVIKENRVVFVF